MEPTTGRRYDLTEAPYQTIQCIFNHKNFWINLDQERAIKDLNMDFEDGQEWEYVMLSDEDKDRGEDDDDLDEDEDSEDEEEQKDNLDMPPSWSPKLTIDNEKFLNLCPNGEKTVFFKKCKVDLFAPCTQIDGIVKRVTLYHDYKRNLVAEVRQHYSNRRDFLRIRVRIPFEFKTIEYYDSSETTHYWRKVITIDSQERTLYFYHHRNNQKDKDGLIYRKEFIGCKTIEKYKDREDKLVYRCLEFVRDGMNSDLKDKMSQATSLKHQDNNIGPAIITKMI